MDVTSISLEELQASRENFTVGDADREHFQRCWSRQTCGACLDVAQCSWCPYTWSCVPNSHSIPALAPAYDEDICPHWAERWEVRTRPLGCHVSTVTSLTAVVSFVLALAVVGLVVGLVFAAKRVRRFNGEHPGWVARARRRVGGVLRNKTGGEREREPLLREDEANGGP